MKREVVLVSQSPRVGLFSLLFLAFLVYSFWKLVLVVIGSMAAAVLIILLVKAVMEDRRKQEELRNRADVQDRWYISGDPRGIYGEGLDEKPSQ